MNAPAITVAELRERAARNHDFFLLDVRTLPEYVAGRLAFSDALLPYDLINLHLDRLPTHKQVPIYCFCRSGRRSDLATLFLRSLGYVNAFNVAGGIIAWVDKGYDIVSGPIDENRL